MGITFIPDVGFRVQRRATINGEIEEPTKLFSIKIAETVEGKTVFRKANKKELAQIKREAKAHDRELERWQKQVKKGFDPFTPTRKNNTGIRGITRRMHEAHNYMIDAFFVCVQYEDESGVKRVHSRYFNIETLGYAEAWANAVDDLVKVKNLTEDVRRKLIKAMPAPTESKNRTNNHE